MAASAASTTAATAEPSSASPTTTRTSAPGASGTQATVPSRVTLSPSTVARGAVGRPGRLRAGAPARRTARGSPCGPRCSGGSGGALALLRPQLGERDSLVEPRLGRQAEHPLADRVAQDLLGPARRLEPGQERDHV